MDEIPVLNKARIKKKKETAADDQEQNGPPGKAGCVGQKLIDRIQWFRLRSVKIDIIFKSIAQPYIRVKNTQEATIEIGRDGTFVRLGRRKCRSLLSCKRESQMGKMSYIKMIKLLPKLK